MQLMDEASDATIRSEVGGKLHEIGRYLDEASENGWELVSSKDMIHAVVQRGADLRVDGGHRSPSFTGTPMVSSSSSAIRQSVGTQPQRLCPVPPPWPCWAITGHLSRRERAVLSTAHEANRARAVHARHRLHPPHGIVWLRYGWRSPAALPPGASVPKWDHFCSQVGGTLDAIGRYLDEASENGWELVSWSIAGAGNLACFKRPRIGTPGEAPPASASASSAPAGR